MCFLITQMTPINAYGLAGDTPKVWRGIPGCDRKGP
jgi:hypothetical protein